MKFEGGKSCLKEEESIVVMFNASMLMQQAAVPVKSSCPVRSRLVYSKLMCCVSLKKKKKNKLNMQAEKTLILKFSGFLNSLGLYGV
jgi:hypothetical protein